VRTYSLSLLLLLETLGPAGTSTAQQLESRGKPVISVASMGKAVARPDLAIVSLNMRSSAPLAADALEQNRKKMQDVKTRLAALGYKNEQIRFSGDRFSPAGGQGVYYGGGQRPTGFDVYDNIYVYLDSSDLKDLDQFNIKVGALLDELSKLGVSAGSMSISPYSMGGTSLVAFTVKDPAPFEKDAYLEAMDKARPIADDIARRMKVQVTGVASVSSASMGRISQGGISNADDVPFEYLSSSIDAVPIRVRVTVEYAYSK